MNTNSLYNFIECDISDTIDDILIQDLLNQKATGLIVKNFFSQEEIGLIKSKLNQIPTDKKTIVNDGFTSFPINFAMFTQKRNQGLVSIEEYCDLAQDVLDNQEEYLGINITNRLIDFLSSLKSFSKISPIFEPNLKKPLVPFNVRELKPQYGELVIHCENLFFDEFPNFFKWLKLMDIKDNKLSYFITIQKSDKGGELCCYDLNWKHVKTRKDFSTLVDESGKEYNINDSSVKHQLVAPNEGDLLLFGGGDIWHRVIKIEGHQSRITIGGFIAETNRAGEYYIWS